MVSTPPYLFTTSKPGKPGVIITPIAKPLDLIKI